MTGHTDDTNFAMLMGEVASKLLGEPNQHLSNKKKLRYGTNGSLSVNLEKGTWYDFEAEEGGGVIALIRRVKGLNAAEARQWIKDLGFPLGDDRQARPASNGAAKHSAAKATDQPNKVIVETYDYCDENRELRYQTVRFNFQNSDGSFELTSNGKRKKTFSQRRPDGVGGWIWNLEGVRIVPYRLPELLEDIALEWRIFFVEGEAKVDALRKLGVPATCNPMSAGKWWPGFEEYFRGGDVVILPDNDPQAKKPDGTPRFYPDGRPMFPGQDHAKDVAKTLAGVTRSVRVLELPGLPLKGDVIEWLAAGGTAVELSQLVESNSKPWAEDEIPKGESRPEAAKKTKAGQSPDWWRSKLINAPDLCDLQFSELKYVVSGIFPEGVTLLASRPKLGKSWLLLQIGTAVATGVAALVPNDSPPHGDVLHLALEDNPRRLQRRLRKYFGRDRSTWPARLTIVTDWNRLDQGGLEAIDAWCKSVSKPTLIMIDTLKKVRAPKRNGQSDYDADYEACQGLQKLAGTLGVAIIVAHHDRKMEAEDVFDTVSGTLGLTGGVDTIAVMKRKAGVVTLHVEGRDLDEPIEKAISFDRETCRWTILGEAAEIQRSSERSRVLTVLTTAPDGMRSTEIVAAAGLKGRNAADLLLSRMVQDGEIERVGRGLYGVNGTRANLSAEKPRQERQKDRSKLKPLKPQSDSRQSVDLSDLSHSSTGTDFDPQARPISNASLEDALAREIEL